MLRSMFMCSSVFSATGHVLRSLVAFDRSSLFAASVISRAFLASSSFRLYFGCSTAKVSIISFLKSPEVKVSMRCLINLVSEIELWS